MTYGHVYLEDIGEDLNVFTSFFYVSLTKYMHIYLCTWTLLSGCQMDGWKGCHFLQPKRHPLEGAGRDIASTQTAAIRI